MTFAWNCGWCALRVAYQIESGPRAADILLGMLPKPAHRTAQPESVVWQQLPELKAVQVPIQDAGLKWRPLT